MKEYLIQCMRQPEDSILAEFVVSDDDGNVRVTSPSCKFVGTTDKLASHIEAFALEERVDEIKVLLWEKYRYRLLCRFPAERLKLILPRVM